MKSLEICGIAEQTHAGATLPLRVVFALIEALVALYFTFYILLFAVLPGVEVRHQWDATKFLMQGAHLMGSPNFQYRKEISHLAELAVP